ncbi:MAG: hypothetical protein KYX64_06200 [Sphingopyxis sp.]|nr:hypothetical protein [Sphingopyxis sp.]
MAAIGRRPPWPIRTAIFRFILGGMDKLVDGALAEIMADSGHYSIDSTIVRAHVSAAGGKGGQGSGLGAS